MPTPTPNSSPQTTFPTDASSFTVREIFYALNRYLLGGAPLSRYINGLLLFTAVVWATGLFPGRWWVTALCIIAFACFVIFSTRYRRCDYVKFAMEDLPQIPAFPLSPDAKIPVHATGFFTVEGKYQRFTWLPGFFRTFATGEHATLCLARERRFLRLGRWPEEEVGMWYVFFRPELIQRLRWGELQFSAQSKPAIAVDYQLTIPAGGKFKSDKVIDETVYLACDNEQDARTLLADLLCNLPQASGLESTPDHSVIRP